LRLLQEFKDAHGILQINAVLADALYGEAFFMDEASADIRWHPSH